MVRAPYELDEEDDEADGDGDFFLNGETGSRKLSDSSKVIQRATPQVRL